MVGVAERVGGCGVGAVLGPAVVDGDPLKVRHHAGVVDALGAAPVVQRVERQRLSAGAMKPAQPATGASAGFVEMHDRRADDLLVHPVEELAEIIGAFLDEPEQRRGRERRPEPVRQQPSSALIGQVLRGDQIDRQRPHPGPVLRRRADPSGELRARHAPATAAPPLRTVLADDKTHRRQIELLTGLLADQLAV